MCGMSWSGRLELGEWQPARMHLGVGELVVGALQEVANDGLHDEAHDQERPGVQLRGGLASFCLNNFWDTRRDAG